MPDTTDRILRYYTSEPAKEWRRLAGPDTGPIEFELTTRRLAKHLAPGTRVLDIGGGPGRYTIWLAAQGHRVTLADLVPELLDEARAHISEMGMDDAVEDVVQADVCELGRWPDASFEAVLCLGPFYHLPEPSRRKQAATELARVMKPGGWLFVAFMPRLGFLRRSMAVREEWGHLQQAEFVSGVLERGEFFNNNQGRFDAGYGARPEEIAPFWQGYGFVMEALIATESFAPVVSEELQEMAVVAPEAYACALDILEQTAGEPSILGTANHLLYVGRRV